MNCADYRLSFASLLQWRPNSLADFHNETAASRANATPTLAAAGSPCFLVDSPPRFECAVPARRQTARESAASQSCSPGPAAWHNLQSGVSRPKGTTRARSANEIARSQHLDCSGEYSEAKAIPKNFNYSRNANLNSEKMGEW